MNKFAHKNCDKARGIRQFKCLVCGKEATNYANGIMVCKECCVKRNECQICGRDMGVLNDYM
ncbi:MAG: hypothetical protein ACRDD7_06390 [Peptostreptococcaceae bacterium]